MEETAIEDHAGAEPLEIGVTAPRGFRAAGVGAGIKDSGALDLALVVNDGPLDVAAGVFTRNKVRAAPVLWTREVLADRKLRAVVLNSGGANACTGSEGFQDTHATAETVAESLGGEAAGIGAIDVAVCSTGLIGERLPMDTLKSGVDGCVKALRSTPESATDAARAVLTTDKVHKQAGVQDRVGWSIGGFTKGSGMIAPSMATMLCVLTTDAVVDADVLESALHEANRTTFERLDIDGSMSTNDTVLVLSSGASGVRADPARFTAALRAVCGELALRMRDDAEGVTKTIDVTVRGAVDEEQAVLAARAVARDSLVKTALFGRDPNWGRVAAAVGYSGADLEPDAFDITINGVRLCQNGAKATERSTVDLEGTMINVDVELRQGPGAATIRTTDLSHAYVDENAAYSS